MASIGAKRRKSRNQRYRSDARSVGCNFLKAGQRVPLRWSLPLRSISDKVTHYMPIMSCLDCRHLNVSHCYTPDSFEVVFDWFCGACGNKKIDTAKIPDWCPLPKMEK